jgi:hypothetical protein
VEAFNLLNITTRNPEDFKRVEEYYSGGSGGRTVTQGRRDHLFNSGLQIIKWSIKNIVNHDVHGSGGDNKFRMLCRNNGDWRNQKIPSLINRDHDEIKQYLVIKGFIERHAEGYVIPRNFHPTLFYYMFIYCIDYTTRELTSFSHPFVILNDSSSGALNFPMGITNHNNKIWISYGDGDCRCMVSLINKDKFMDLVSKNNNTTRLDKIKYLVYTDKDLR